MTQIGEANHQAKLTEEQVREIRRLLRSKVSTTTIADLYGISHKLVWKIRHNLLWRHVDD